MMWRQTVSEYGMLLVLLVLCAVLSVLTYAEQFPEGAAAAPQVADDLVAAAAEQPWRVLIVTGDKGVDQEFAEELGTRLRSQSTMRVEAVAGQPVDARAKLEAIVQRGETLDAIVATPASAAWGVIARRETPFPSLAKTRVVTPRSYRWPTFLKRDNLRNITSQIAIIAIVAIGMTMVIITGGIDLSVGSLIALSAVVSTQLIRYFAGAEQATAGGMTLCCLTAIGVSTLAGFFSGAVTTLLRIPSFIVTLSVMQMAIGLAEKISNNQSINQVPSSFVWLGGGADLLGIPNSVVLALLLYLAAHFVMSRMTLGRYLYAVGGNAEAARLSGVPVRRVTLIAFALCGALAGLGGVALASQLKSGSPTYGQSYELYVIAAVVVGGTSLSGGEGKIFGTLIGALIISVIHNGMNLLNIESPLQKVVLGAVILVAVLLDRLRRSV